MKRIAIFVMAAMIAGCASGGESVVKPSTLTAAAEGAISAVEGAAPWYLQGWSQFAGAILDAIFEEDAQ